MRDGADGFGCTDPGGAGPASGGGTSAACDPPTCAGATQRVRPVSRRGDGQLRRRAEGIHRRPAASRPARRSVSRPPPASAAPTRHRGRRGRRDCPPPPTCATADRGVRGLSGRDAAELHEQRHGLRRRLLLPPEAPVCVAVNRRGLAPARAPAVVAVARRRRPAAPTGTLQPLRGRDSVVVHRHHRRLRGDLLLCGRYAPCRERRRQLGRHRRARRRRSRHRRGQRRRPGRGRDREARARRPARAALAG